MSERQPTDAEWRLVAEVTGLTVNRLGAVLLGGGTVFDPHHDHNDLARLIEALVKKFYLIKRSHSGIGTHTRILLPGNDRIWIDKTFGMSDPGATFWACVEALKEKEKRDARTDTDG